MPGPSPISDESVVPRRTNGQFVSRKRSVKCSRGIKLAEKWKKTILEKRREEGEVGSSAQTARRLQSVGHNLLQVESSEHFGSVNFVMKTLTNKRSLNNSQEAGKENEQNVGSRIVHIDSFMKDMDKCKSCHEDKHISQANKMQRSLYLNFKIFKEITDSIIEATYKIYYKDCVLSLNKIISTKN